MEASKNKKIRTTRKTKTNELELTSLVESTEKLETKPVRRIYRCPTKIKESVEDMQQRKDPGETSDQPRFSAGHENSQQTAKESNDVVSQQREALSDNNYKARKLEESLPRFGPLYSVDQPSVQATKDKAWEHVLKKSPENDPKETTEIYIQAIREVEQEAKEIYADKVSGMESNFRWMMIKDGCFFLQLAFLILGCCDQLGYPQNDPIFGKKHNKKDLKKWIEAMFFVGNQIPLVVLKELMKQKFFADVVKKGKWDPPPSGLCKKVLFELLVLPALKRNLPNRSFYLKERLMRKGSKVADQDTCDLIHGLQNLVLGPYPLGHSSGEYEPDDEIDLEGNDGDIGDYARIFANDVDDEDGTSPTDTVNQIRRFLTAIGLSSAIDDRKRIFPCATELKRAGITIKKLKDDGIRSIDFKSYYLQAYLYLPAFPVDDNAEMLFLNLKTYEISQPMGKHKREASAYLRFMSDIIQTTRDVKLLQEKGIIQGSPDDAEKLPGILSRLSSEDIRLTHEFHILRRKIRDYSSPWIHYKGVVNLVVFLTLLQTLFTLLAYFRPPKN